jgi:uncharacterized protein
VTEDPSRHVDARGRRPAMFMRWLSLAFIHWPVSVEQIRRMNPAIPPGLEIDTFDGSAWVGLVPFTMRDVRPTWSPSIPGFSHFHECNVRTYVRRPGDSDSESGVWFFSLDAASRPAVWGAKTFFHLPYFHSRIILNRKNDLAEYEVNRVGDASARMRCSWRVGEPMSASSPGSLEHFLTERYSLFAADIRQRLFRGRIRHAPWPLRRATLESLDDRLLPAAGLPAISGDPVVFAAEELAVHAWSIEPA